VSELRLKSIEVQIQALIDSWKEERAERLELASGMATDGNKSYQQGYADALDRCIQGIKLLRDSIGGLDEVR
jgi:hypothetical protein